MDEQTRTDNSTEVQQGRMSPAFLIASSWLILGLLVLLFGYDINYWAFGSDNGFMQERVVPQTQKLSGFCVDSGIRGARTAVEDRVHPIYDDSPLWAEIEEADDE
ncbi:MAG: hypothetical protein R3F46_02070 [bacterium]